MVAVAAEEDAGSTQREEPERRVQRVAARSQQAPWPPHVMLARSGTSVPCSFWPGTSTTAPK